MKKCEQCGKEYEPPYKDKKLIKLSGICPKCVEKHNERCFKWRQKILTDYNNDTELQNKYGGKHGFNYAWYLEQIYTPS
jgi:hypothetical protein